MNDPVDQEQNLIDTEMFADYPEGIVLLEVDGRTEILRVRKMLSGPLSCYSFAYDLDHGDDAAQWGVPVCLQRDDNLTHLGSAEEALLRMSNQSWFREHYQVFVKELPVTSFGHLPFLRAAHRLNGLGRDVAISDVVTAIKEARSDWEARVRKAADLS